MADKAYYYGAYATYYETQYLIVTDAYESHDEAWEAFKAKDAELIKNHRQFYLCECTCRMDGVIRLPEKRNLPPKKLAWLLR